MPAKKAEIAIERSPIIRNGGKEKRIVTCPVCGKCSITLVKRVPEPTSFNVALGIQSEIWEAARNESDPGDYGMDWEGVLANHVKAHTAGEIVSKIYKLEDDAAAWQYSAAQYADFVGELAKTNSNELRRWLEQLKRSNMTHIPDEMKDY